MPNKYLDPNSGAAPQPGGQAEGRLTSVEEFQAQQEMEREHARMVQEQARQVAQGPEFQDEGTEVSQEAQDQAMSGAVLDEEPAQDDQEPQPLLAQAADLQFPKEAGGDLDRLNKQELLALARERNIRGYSTMDKGELLAALKRQS